jgi:endonuclease YncB( thermonuclease family)
MADKTPNPFYGNATSVYRDSSDGWKFTFRLEGLGWADSTITKAMGSKNQYADARLKEILDLLDSQGKKTWPWGKGLTDSEDFLVSYKRDSTNIVLMKEYFVSSMEMTVQAYRQALSALKPENAIAQNKMRDSLRDDLTAQLPSNLVTKWEHLPAERGWMITGYVTKVRDGDTIEIKIKSVGANLVAWDKRSDPDNEVLAIGNTIPIRFLGIQTPETQKDWTNSDEEYNDVLAKEYAVDPSIVYAVGLEAKHATEKMCALNNGFVVIDVDTADNGDPARSVFTNENSTETRFVGMVYLSSYNTSRVEDPMTQDDWYLDMNKTLIASPSTQTYGDNQYIPLADVASPYTYGNANTRYDIALWETTIAYGADDKVAEIEAADKAAVAAASQALQEELAKMSGNNGQTKRVIDQWTVTGRETLDAIVKDYASRGITISKELLISSNNLVPDENGNYVLSVGQVILIPRIELMDNSPVDENGTPVFEMNFGEVLDNTLEFFPPKDDRRELTSPYHARIGDVQFLIPPLSISSNRVSTIEKVRTLRTKSSMMTKVGSSHKTVTLQLYFHDLETINGYKVPTGTSHTKPIMTPEQYILQNGKAEVVADYYYMDGLRSLIAQFKKAPFLPIENDFINDALEIYDVILVNLSVATVPGFPHSLAATLTLAEFDHEAYMPHVTDYGSQINYPMLRWYYQQALNPEREGNPYKTYLAPIEGQLRNDFYFQIANEDELINRMEAAKELRFTKTPEEFDAAAQEGKNSIGDLQRDGLRADDIIKQYNNWLGVKDDSDYPDAKEFQYFGNKSEWYKKIYGEDFKVSNEDGFFLPAELILNWPTTTDYFYIKLESRNNIRKYPESYLLDGRENLYRFPVNSTTLQYIKEISKSGADAITAQKGYALYYQKLKEKAEGTEANLPMEDVYIDDLIITQMNVMYENSFSMVQMQAAANPTYQYLGSQDPRIEIMLEATSVYAITQLKDLLNTCDRYSREFRYGITSGFLGFQNQLAALFGVTSVMIESCQIDTVPGFVDRFQIQLVLCGFDKTQKRTESLSGFSGAYSTAKADRYVTKDVVSKDAIVIDRKMKDLELYPDLELPTYEEINAALPKLNAGFEVYHNSNAAKYVDPDFYVSTSWTFRDYFKQFKKNDGSDDQMGLMKLEDFSGMVGTYRVNSNGKFFEPSDEYLKVAENIDARTKNTAAEEFLKQQAQAQEEGIAGVIPADATDNQAVHIAASSAAQDLQGMRKWIDNINNINTKPSIADIGSWYGLSLTGGDAGALNSIYQSLGTNPTRLEFYKELYSLVDEFFVAPGYVFDERTVNTDLVRSKITYGRVGDVADAMYLWLKNTQKEFRKIPSIKEPEALSAKDFNATKGRITRERIANIMKSVFDLESDWNQFWEQGGRMVPKKNKSSSAVGIGQCMLYWHGVSPSYAQRLCWDWKENLRWSVKYFCGKFEAAMKSTNPQVRCRPWDWAIRMYNWGSMPKDGNLFNDYFNAVNTIFQGSSNTVDAAKRTGMLYNAPQAAGAAPGEPINNEIYAVATGMTSSQQKMVAGSDDEMKTALRNQGIGLTLANYNRPLSLEYAQQVSKLDKMTHDELKAFFDKIMAAIDKIQQETKTGQYTELTSATISSDASVAVNYKKTIDILKANNLTNTDDPDKLWRDMFTDMMEYDQRGRMLRAFPTFQMFIIDEGRWMTNYKLWDNLYGFNAIQSIDVHKSRKIAADTAVIKMTNLYSNLTSRRFEETYGDWTYDLIDNLFWGNPSQQLMNARKELVSGMMLETGARIHLRMGYGSDATSLPVMFNGTITELDTEDLVTIIAQGDGLELTNIISADPDETNDGGLFGRLTEPRDLLCNFLTSKGNWFKNVVNDWTDAKFFKQNPLGIQHFGSPVKVPDRLANVPALFGWFRDNGEDSMGEAVQNIYSSNGFNTFSQWRYLDGTEIDNFTWSDLFNMNWPDGDELNVELKFYGQTVWDIAQDLAYVSPDYIAAVHPFEMRSTLFFGKPYYKMAYRYDSTYKWEHDDKTGITNWRRYVSNEFRKPYQQFHVFNSIFDIIGNNIKASEEGVYTNVVAMGRGESSLLQQADADIRYDKQKTKVVETNIVSDGGPDFWGIKKQLNYYAQSALRDYVKDMYKGSLVVLGDPSVKPHDMCHMADTLHDMNGPFLVKDVTHSFSLETGFITVISPDAVVVVDDAGTISQASWFTSAAIGATTSLIGRHAVGRGLRRVFAKGTMMRKAGDWSADVVGKSMMKLLANVPHDKSDVDFQLFKNQLKQYTQETDETLRKELLGKMGKTIEKMKPKLTVNATTKAGKLANFGRTRLGSLSSGVIKNLSSGRNALAFLRAGSALTSFASVGVTVLSTMALTYMTKTLIDGMKRKQKARQALMILPLQYQGRNFTAGLNGVQGAVVGTKPGKMDLFYMGAGYGGKDDWTRTLGRALGWLTDTETLGDNYTDEDMLNLKASYYLGSSSEDRLNRIDSAYTRDN